ncbi:unnamed protein product [Diatraea saccharalis]|uniref:Uncharacterized protein n=1 Tax=Diatraea saccharalis TaxID=40085 RepID=A0A9N9WFV3_9NEOP|nr:unnamed protein product [Diatraea saccharalis]
MGSNKTLKLIEKIRRQLMKDNYDYLESEEDATTPTAVDNQQSTTKHHDHRNDSIKVFGHQGKAVARPEQYNGRIDERHDRINQNLDALNIFPDQSDDELDKLLNESDKYADITAFKPPEFNSKDYPNYPDLQRSTNRNQNHMNVSPNRGHKSTDLISKQITGSTANRNNGELDAFDQGDDRSERNKYPKLSETYIEYESSPAKTYNFHKQAYGKKDAIPRIVDSWIHNYAPIKHRGFSVSQRDLLYYMDDKRMRRKGEMDGFPVENATSAESDDYIQDVTNDTTPTAKYKVIKVKGAKDNPSRRNMAIRRFVEEKKDDEVAIIRLDDGPFPQFTLPRSRRQYMYRADTGLNGTMTDSDTS